MKMTSFAILITLFCASWGFANEADLQLPAPNKENGKPVMKCMTERKTDRLFSGKALTEQQLSNLLYSAVGINRDDGKRVIPTARNMQDLVVYAVLPNGFYQYNPSKNCLNFLGQGNRLGECCVNEKMGSSASVLLIYVSNQKAKKLDIKYAAMHAGSAYQNVALYCASEGLGNVVIGMLKYDQIKTLLKLSDDEIILVGQLVGTLEKK